jgi:HAD superfamily hydrolase (TIGR01509 family)
VGAPLLLLFDLGGVLLENATFKSLSRLLPKTLELADLKHRWLMSASVRHFELGEMSPDRFAEAFIDEWGVRLTPEEFLKEFSSWPRGFYPGVDDLLRTLRRKYRIGCLSNSNVVHWEKFNGFSDHFDIALSSHLMGSIKPDEEVYFRALRECDSEATETCFFDDQLANVETAQRLGIKAHLVEGVAQLRDVLRSEGLLQS